MENPILPIIIPEYNRFKAFISNGYIKSFYSHAASHSSLLKDLNSDQIKRLADKDIADTNDLREIGMILVLILVFSAVLKSIVPASWNYIASVAYPILLFTIELSLFWLHNNKFRESHVTDRLFFALLSIEDDTWDWDLNADRWKFSARLERLARDIERIPLNIKRVAPSVRNECLKISRMKAQAIRDLELSVIKWQLTTCDELTIQLKFDLCLMIQGQWYDLPEADYVHQSSKLKSVAQIIGVLITLGGAIAIASYASKLGSVAQILATVLITISVAILSSSGISTDIMARSAEVGSNILSKK